MISVLIPIYNYNVSNLVSQIYNQLLKTNITFEIICIDDASNNNIYEYDFLKSPFIKFERLETNIGRSKIRNLLASKAKYEWLLFLDSDVIPESENFINNYIKILKVNSEKVFCGGIKYQKTVPPSIKLLRWVYGKKREEITSDKRLKKEYQYFFTANILVRKATFEIVQFNEFIVKYGYEDVLFAHDLFLKSKRIIHINNPVIHLGIEENDIFLFKTKQAIENLSFLYNKKLISNEFISLLKVYKKIKCFKLNHLLGIVFKYFSKYFENNLKSLKPSMAIFDLYKLSYFCYLESE